MLLACSRRSDRGEHAVLHYSNAWTAKMLSAYGLLGGEGVGEKIDCPILSSAPPPPPTFYFAPPPLSAVQDGYL